VRLTLVMPFAAGVLRFRGPLLRLLRERGHEVFVLSPDPGEAIRRGLQDLGVGWRAIPLARGGLSPRADLSAIRAMRATLRELRPDLSIGFNPKGVLHGTIAAAEAAVPRRFAMVTGLGFAFTRPAGLTARLAPDRFNDFETYSFMKPRAAAARRTRLPEPRRPRDARSPGLAEDPTRYVSKH
jgi:hypothetical protein